MTWFDLLVMGAMSNFWRLLVNDYADYLLIIMKIGICSAVEY